MKASEQIAEFLKLAEKATPGKWVYDDNGAFVAWTKDNGHSYESLIADMRGVGASLSLDDNGRFISQSRTLGPKLAMALQAAIKTLQFYETQHNWPIHADVALQEIDSIFNPKDEWKNEV